MLGRMMQPEGGAEAIGSARAILGPQDFYRTCHQQMYTVILELHDAGSPVDDWEAKPYQAIYRDMDRIDDMPPPVYLEYLRDSTPSAANAEYYAEKVKEASRLREIIQVVSFVEKQAYDMDATPAALVTTLGDLMDRNQVIGSVAGRIPTARDEWPQVFAMLCAGQQSEFLGLRTGFEGLDRATLGLRGLCVLGGMPGQGKSTMALQMAGEIAGAGVPVLYYSLEMARFDLYVKIISRLSRLDYTTLRIGSEIDGHRGCGLSDQDKGSLSQATSEFMRYADRMRIMDREVCRDISLPLVRLHIQQARREFDAQQVFVVIDHLQIFPCHVPELGDMKSRLDYLVSEFKAISQQYDAVILLISEKNRAGYRSRDIGSYMGSAGIEYGVDLAMLLYEEDEEDDEKEYDDGEREIEVRVVKNRFGSRRKIRMRFHPEISKFTEIKDSPKNKGRT